MSNKKYLSEIIGDDFKDWSSDKIHVITAPTGVGKTHFILNSLLEYVIRYNMRVLPNEKQLKILYFVNRAILKEQLDDKIGKKLRELNCWESPIELKTYQEMEYLLLSEADTLYSKEQSNNPMCKVSPVRYSTKSSSNYVGSNWLDDLRYFRTLACHLDCYTYIVCDETHYFFADSTFNTNTLLSYKWILSRALLTGNQSSNNYTPPVCIFMSATPEVFMEVLHQDLAQHYTDIHRELGDNNIFNENRVSSHLNEINGGSPDYSNIIIHIIEDKDKISDIPQLEHDKWLIFINDKDKGRKLCKDIQEQFTGKNEVTFLDANFRYDAEAKKTVGEISYNEAFASRILITTSVLDNGVTIHDKSVRNVIILAETREEFLQMLGRKREENTENKSPLNLYICKQSAQFFQERMSLVIAPHIKLIEKCRDWSRETLLDEVTNPQYSRYLLHLLSSFCGTLVLNEFSMKYYENLESIYSDLLESFKNDENAFLKMQCDWLGKDYSELTVAIKRHEEETVPVLIDNFQELIHSYDGRIIEGKTSKHLRDILYGNKEQWGPLRQLIKSTQMGKTLDTNIAEKLRKNSHHPAKDEWNVIFEHFQLPYRINDSGILEVLSNNNI